MLVTASLAHAQGQGAGVAPGAGAAPGAAAAPAAPGAAAAPAAPGAAPAAPGAAAAAPGAAAAPAAPGAAVPAAPAATGADAAAPATTGEAAVDARLAAAEKRAAELEKRLAAIEDAQAAPEQDDGKELLRLYGFIDAGVQRLWVPESSVLAAASPQANATNFVVGNLNLYLDAQPSDHFRFLGELRFTTAPGGAPVPVPPTTPLPPGVVGRVTTQEYGTYDSTAIALGSPLTYGGLVSIERAHIDWTRFNLFKVRVGQFFTPIGIYNVDHGSPVLITAAIPYFITSRLFPTRQTGVMLYGSTFTGPWELGYNAYVSNGRNENAPFAFDDTRGFGGRLHASYEDPGKLALKLGASFIASSARDWVADYKVGELTPTIGSTWSFREYIGAGDVSLDFGSTRLRAEAAVVRVIFDEGKRQGGGGFFAPDAWKTSTYAVAAHRFDFLNMEPFVIGAALHAPFFGHDTMFQVGGGLNFYITPDVTLRTQVLRTIMTVLRDEESAVPGIPPVEDFHTTAALARLILAF
ncbi:hypothetical protein [Sorangium sp. So ce406]|uniref:hypothetical protein n=1 Tax=Sorangium sp. So ce406 TaxID=3133311 RepID=UPI003F5B31FA